MFKYIYNYVIFFINISWYVIIVEFILFLFFYIGDSMKNNINNINYKLSSWD